MDHHQDTPATDIDLLDMLAAARRQQLPKPISHQVTAFDEVYLHVHNADEAGRWVAWWTERGASAWNRRRHLDDNHSIHNHHIGMWRGAEIKLVYLSTVQELTEVPV